MMHIYDASAGSTDKDRRVNASRFAIITEANLFTGPNNISPTGTTQKALALGAPASTSVAVLSASYAGQERMRLEVLSNVSQLTMSPFDNGALAGGRILADRNTNASTPAAGTLGLRDKGGQTYWIWPDDSGVLRIDVNLPVNANDTAGTVVGAQTSSLDSKDIAGEPIAIDDVLAAVRAGAEAVRRFTYKSGSFNGEEFSGVVVDYAPRYGMDRDAEHPAGKSLSVITVVGDLLMAVSNLAERVAALEAAQSGA
ncbi:MAG: hypothetical protein IPM06_19640 [Rhizobiales bacterium]|nr:hypothetical protein [Hyphomicrobiales bacterium]